MFRALTCSSSGGKIIFTQHLVTSLSVNVCTVHWFKPHFQKHLRDFKHGKSKSSVLCRRLQRAKISGTVWIQFVLLKMGMLMLKHVEDNSVTNILLMNKENCALKLVDEIILPNINKHRNLQVYVSTISALITFFVILYQDCSLLRFIFAFKEFDLGCTVCM